MRSNFVDEVASRPALAGWRPRWLRTLLRSPMAIRDLVFLAEAMILAASHLVVHVLYFDLVLQSEPDAWYRSFAVLNAVAYLIARRAGASPQCREFGRFGSAFEGSARALLIAATAFLVFGFLGKFGELVSRGWFLSAFLVGGLSIALLDAAVVRTFAYLCALSDNPFLRRIALVGEPGPASTARRLLEQHHGDDAIILGPFAGGEGGAGYSWGQPFAELRALAERGDVDHVVLSFEAIDEPAIKMVVEQLASYPVEVSLYPVCVEKHLSGLAPFASDDLPLVTLIRQPANHWGLLGKFLIDRFGSALALLFLAPFLLLVAILIKLESPGPVFFRQKRHGFGHVPFDVYKFRTMRQGSDDGSQSFRQAQRDDPRITRVGALLRRSSIDELPQLLNVLKGEMSLVGPRPHPLPLNARFSGQLPFYVARHRVLPGITGLAQINGFRGETDTTEKMAARLECDLDYIRRWSLWLDIKIIVTTLFVGFIHKNAY